jgi:hypothetical protein
MAKRIARFTEAGPDGKEVSYVVKFPTRQQQHGATLASIRAFNEAKEAGAIPRECLNQYMMEQGLWDKEKQERLEKLSRDLNDGERQLARGGVSKDGKKFTKDEAKELAVNMRVWRIEQLLLLSKSRELDKFTLESQADNAKFDYLVSECTFTEDGHKVFESLEDYIARSEDKYAVKAAIELSNMLYDMDDDYEKNKPENKFLLKFGFARETDLHLINKEGKLVDAEGRLVNENGRLIDPDGNLIDIFGKRVNEEGDPVEEFVPFDEDEDVAEVVETVEAVETEA